ncbi:MAG TPA: basic secretory protein-like protein, partial [Gemmatimonadales bacterium]|nr:basic secretory protein-like protein [Gemmatimonadales bacterium]
MQTWRQVTVAAAVAAAALVAARPASAQYFGQNKVQYRSFPFKIIQTEHFEVYYYDEERAAALDAARMAERGYARLSRVLHHKFQARKPIILYASHTDFEQTNAIEGELGEGTGGVTEFFKHRMVLPFTGSYAELEHVLQHEMVHQFQYDVISGGRIGAGVQTLVNVNPPEWFMEGMAEYLSLGPIDAHTAMWLRDASLEGDLPTIEQLTYDPRVFPYHYGHALWSYIGEKWGDEVIGEILQAATSSGVEGAFKRALGLSLDDLSNEWRDAVQTTFLPQLSEHYRARRIAQPLLTEKRTGGGYHLAPALTPDGREVAFFGERNSFFIDLYLADAESGRTLRRLVKSTINSNYESLRFVNSSGSFSPDGRYFAITAKRKQHEDLVILDVKRGREDRRIQVPLNGLETPTWSPDGQQLVFTGFDGGLSDLFIINRDGTGLRRLTTDKYADLQPAWSPDGKTIAFLFTENAPRAAGPLMPMTPETGV